MITSIFINFHGIDCGVAGESATSAPMCGGWAAVMDLPGVCCCKKKNSYLFTPKHRYKVSLIAQVVPLCMGWIEVRGFSRYVWKDSSKYNVVGWSYPSKVEFFLPRRWDMFSFYNSSAFLWKWIIFFTANRTSNHKDLSTTQLSIPQVGS